MMSSENTAKVKTQPQININLNVFCHLILKPTLWKSIFHNFISPTSPNSCSNITFLPNTLKLPSMQYQSFLVPFVYIKQIKIFNILASATKMDTMSNYLPLLSTFWLTFTIPLPNIYSSVLSITCKHSWYTKTITKEKHCHSHSISNCFGNFMSTEASSKKSSNLYWKTILSYQCLIK